ncbi:MAG TPA: alpha/beta hydrolase [Stellaceae bacterium]|nr:alpha/beta hydrolase [Stellaceae bacterium]
MLKNDAIRLKSGRKWSVHSGGSGPDLLWLHGLRGVDAADPLLLTLAAGHRVIAPVAPGFNDLDELAEIDDIHELALDYDDLLDGLGLHGVPIVGHSFGAMMAAEIAAHFPQRATRLVLLSPVGLWNDADPVADLFGLPVAEMDRMLWHDAAACEAHAARLAAASSDQGQVEAMIAATRSIAAVTKFVWPIPDKGLRRRLRRITAPTLVVFGAADEFVPARYAADFAAGIAHCETAILEGAGHMVPYEKTETVTALIERFLKTA